MSDPSTKNDSGEKVKRSGPFGAPGDVYLAIFSDAEGVRRAAGAIGAASDDLRVFAGPDDEEAFADLTLERLEPASGGTVIREIFAGDEVETEKHYREAVAGGGYVLQVAVDDEDRESRNQVEEALLNSGGRYVHYYSDLTFEDVVADKDRS